jgi:hypothetical protein
MQHDYHRGLTSSARGIAFDLQLLQWLSHDTGCPAHLTRLARQIGYRDRRSIEAPLRELFSQGKIMIWQDSLYSPLVCRLRHAEAVRRAKPSPVPPQVGALVDELDAGVNYGENFVEEMRKTKSTPPESTASDAQEAAQPADSRS